MSRFAHPGTQQHDISTTGGRFLFGNDTSTPRRNERCVLKALVTVASALMVSTERTTRDELISHALSARVITRLRERDDSSSGLSDAAMIVALRQEIFVANLTQRPMELIIEHCNINHELEPASDPMWTYRIIAHTAKITNFVYTSTTRPAEQFDQLTRYLVDWRRAKPHSFNPIYQTHSSPESFPTLWYACDYHVAAEQYSCLCEILLRACEPTPPFLGVGRAESQRRRDEESRIAVRRICGIALTNREYFPALLTAGMSIAMCGELFVDIRDTEVLLSVLEEAESHLGWPSLKVKERLRSFWLAQGQ